MAKIKTAWFCSNCGVQAAKWVGYCPSCGEWNTYQEEVVQRQGHETVAYKQKRPENKPVAIRSIAHEEDIRFSTYSVELDRVLGGGLVLGSLVLVGGEPGIGKSTLMLQAALRSENVKVLYISGEESEEQIKMRADRIGIQNEDCFILTETSLDIIMSHIDVFSPQMVIIDSIQTLHTSLIDSSAGSISQIRECASTFQRWCKTTNVPVFLIGHITKEGAIAGPKLLEHMVDVALYFEGDRNYGYRILRSIKNRFGSTNELGIFEMQRTGLREVHNPSEILISHRDEPVSGVAISATIEGLRPLLIEVQALVGTAAYGTPQRSSTSFDVRRVNMLLAVLEKRCGFKLNTKDVFLNIAGGLRVDDPAIDLSVVCAILSSSVDVALSPKDCFAGEVGLSGEIRSVSRLEMRIAEAEKLGFSRMFVSKYGMKNILKTGIEIVPVNKIEEIVKKIFK
ncbi:MAG: DNA repair protein RadA [Bacteroidales bacterium]|jgi:DNA repair protein RadA/Sms|nr:DNA repair protein RadA [Bacteroidales bacterium]